MYADDMLILSKSPEGLQKALDIIQVYCNKWQLMVNTDKTKVMIFNKTKVNDVFKYKGDDLQIVHEYTYLGVKIHKSGSFKAAIKALALKAQRAFFALLSKIKGLRLTPRIHIKLFDSLVKPIALYACEVWGGFDLKAKLENNIFERLMNNDKSLYEKLNLMLCKRCLGLPKQANNNGCRAELGRIPLAKSIITRVLKYSMRSEFLQDNDPLKLAFASQKRSNLNYNKSYTYTNLCMDIMTRINVPPPIVTNFQTSESTKRVKQLVNKFGTCVKRSIVNQFKEMFKANQTEIRNTENSKLRLHSVIKNEYC
jgi:hypothetical protein